jgi:hypothetical protein
MIKEEYGNNEEDSPSSITITKEADDDKRSNGSSILNPLIATTEEK